MVSVEIVIPQFLQHLTGGMPAVKVRGNTVGECLSDLIIRFPGLKTQIFDKQGKLKKHLDIWTGKEGGDHRLEQPVARGDRLTIINIIAGG